MSEGLTQYPPRSPLEERFPSLMKILEYVVKEESKKSIVDRFARAISEDMIIQALYDALRIAHGKVDVDCTHLAKEVEVFQDMVRKNPAVAIKLANIVLARTHYVKPKEKTPGEQATNTKTEK